MKTLVKNNHIRLILLMLAVNIGFFGFTNPESIPSFGLVAGFLLFTATLYVFVQGVFKLGEWYGIAYSERRKRFARIVTGVIAGAVALQSIGQLSSRDLMLIVPFAVVVYFYLSYGGRKSNAQQ